MKCQNCNRQYGSKVVVINKIGFGATHATKREDWSVIEYCCKNPQLDPRHRGVPALIKTGKFYDPTQKFALCWREGMYVLSPLKEYTARVFAATKNFVK